LKKGRFLFRGEQNYDEGEFMTLSKDQVIMTGTTTGVTIEQYEGKYSIKSVRTYKGKDGNEVLTYDWIYPEVYDKDQKKRVVSSKPRPTSIPLGTREETISTLRAVLSSLDDKDTPF
jgi:hypothetical protein